MKVKTKKALWILLLLFLVFYMVFQLFRTLYRPLKTEIVTENKIEDYIDTEVFVLREEIPLSKQANGVITPIVPDAERVAENQTVVLIFEDEKDASNYFNKLKLEKELEHIRKIKATSSFVNIDVDKFKAEVINQAGLYVKAVSNQDFSAFDLEKSELKDKITVSQILAGENIDTSEAEKEINQKMSAFSTTSNYKTVASPYSGYFISKCDGHETDFDVSKIEKLDFENIKKTLSKDIKQENNYGKIIYGFKWYVFCEVPKVKGETMPLDASYRLDFPYTKKDYERPIIKLISKKTHKDKIQLIFVGDTMNANIANLRHEKAKIIKRENKGLKINALALRTNDKKEKGVYVLNGEVLEFKKVDIIQSTEKYAISRKHNDDKTYVDLYDNVVIGGKDLYDGKVIR
ncbi:MAG: HlyD family efflux transporter periplasmic adaptor subunit [Clostridia bacterium]|nr:HlyD family efflux transporter periplasmic adaptor subunit [Clostridia bacterium]